MSNKILLAIPSYNCEKQIVRVINEFDKNLLIKIGKIIIIDNQSKDNTIKNAINTIKRKKLKKFVVLKNDHNYGLGGSHKIAFLYGRNFGFSHVAILHGDNQAKTQELNLFIDQVEHNPDLDAVLGSRFMKKSNLLGYSKMRIFGNLILNFIFTLLTFRLTEDLGSGLNIFSLRAFLDDNYLKFSDGLTFNIDLLLYLYKSKKQLKFIPITWREVDQVSNAKTINVGLDALKMLIKWKLDRKQNLVSKKYSFTKIY